MFRKLLSWVLVVQHIYVYTLAAYGPEGGSEYREKNSPHLITIKRTASDLPEGRLIVPSKFQDIEALVVDPQEKTFSLLRHDQEPLPLENAFQPVFPWHLSSDVLLKVVQAHTFFLKQFDDGTFKFEMRVPGLGGIGGWDGSSSHSDGGGGGGWGRDSFYSGGGATWKNDGSNSCGGGRDSSKGFRDGKYCDKNGKNCRLVVTITPGANRTSTPTAKSSNTKVSNKSAISSGKDKSSQRDSVAKSAPRAQPKTTAKTVALPPKQQVIPPPITKPVLATAPAKAIVPAPVKQAVAPQKVVAPSPAKPTTQPAPVKAISPPAQPTVQTVTVEAVAQPVPAPSKPALQPQKLSANLSVELPKSVSINPVFDKEFKDANQSVKSLLLTHGLTGPYAYWIVDENLRALNTRDYYFGKEKRIWASDVLQENNIEVSSLIKLQNHIRETYESLNSPSLRSRVPSIAHIIGEGLLDVYSDAAQWAASYATAHPDEARMALSGLLAIQYYSAGIFVGTASVLTGDVTFARELYVEYTTQLKIMESGIKEAINTLDLTPEEKATYSTLTVGLGTLAKINTKTALPQIQKTQLIEKIKGIQTKVNASKVHKNSLNYEGPTHVYQIVKEGEIQKIGESAQGVNKLGQSIRAESQARKLRKETGDVHETKIIKHFDNKRDARAFETQQIVEMKTQNPEALPLNKNNR